MKIYSFLLSVLIPLGVGSITAQTYFTKEGTISFYSHTPVEDIEAVNQKAVSILNLDESKVEFSVLIKGFHFKNALMQTHFNENYMDSNTYPKAVFKSNFMDLAGFDLKKDGEYEIPVKGTLTVRGKDKLLDTTVTLKVSGGQLGGNAEFTVSPSDFDIEIPSVVRGKIADQIQVKVQSNYQIYEKS